MNPAAMDLSLNPILGVKCCPMYVRISICGVYLYVTRRQMRVRNSQCSDGREIRIRRKMKRRLYAESGGRCQICGRELEYCESSMHHVVPVAVDPSRKLDITNVQLLCQECHHGIHNAALRKSLEILEKI